jgi:peptidoglycan hydrolase-like protein with peptidoglycan-binding domain
MMQRFLTAAAVVSTMALATSGLALAQGATTSPSGAVNPSTSAPATTTPGMTPSSGMTNPSTGGTSSATMGGQAQNSSMDQGAQSPRDIRQAQEQLKQQGLYKGRVDGKMGRETAEAISKFQQQNGLPQNSQLDQQTMAKLSGNGGTGMSTNGSGSSTPPASMKPSTSNPGAGSSMGSGGASTPTGTTSMPNATGGTTTSH